MNLQTSKDADYQVSQELAGYSKRVKEGEMAEPEKITVDEVKKRMDKGDSILFIDTRNPKAWGESDVKLPGALRIHFSELDNRLKELPHNRPIIAYCT